MKHIYKKFVKKNLQNLRLNRKMQFTFFAIIIPLFVLFIVLLTSIFSANQKYDAMITNATEASRFSITFKEDFDYAVYVLVAWGESEEVNENIDSEIAKGRDICTDLINNTSIEDNTWRAQRILKMLDNLEKYVGRIRENKKIGGYYEENYAIWENDVQIVTSLIQSTVLEYAYYETKGMHELRAEINSELNHAVTISLVVFGLLALIAIILSVLIPNSIVKPIYHLNEVTNQVANGDLTIRAKPLSGVEVKQLGISLNSMIDEINHLVQAVKKDEQHIREAEFELLQSQINPHFLYNTLDTIVWLAESGNQETVVDMVTSLSDFFRVSLSGGSGFIMFDEELRHVRSYLEIQQVRYQDILSYKIDSDPRFEHVKIPKITLQPIVENALYHGIKNCRGKGEIHISTLLENLTVVISIEDNGIGMKPDELEKVKAGIYRVPKGQPSKTKIEKSFGLYNVHERIFLKFGEGYGLSIQSTFGEGTIVQVRIPFQKI